MTLPPEPKQRRDESRLDRVISRSHCNNPSGFHMASMDAQRAHTLGLIRHTRCIACHCRLIWLAYGDLLEDVTTERKLTKLGIHS